MRLTDFDALSFDCYGTLIDWESGLKRELRRVASLGSRTIADDVLLESYAIAESEAERRFPEMRYPEIIARSAIATGKMHGIVVPLEIAVSIGLSVKDWPAFPDSTEALTRLSQRYRLIILSNVDRESFAASNALLGVTFDAVLTAEDIGSYKPDPRNFEALIKQVRGMGIAPERLLHVAQSLFHDHVPARNIGLRSAWINRRKGLAGAGATPPVSGVVSPDWVFPTLRDFADATEDPRN